MSERKKSGRKGKGKEKRARREKGDYQKQLQSENVGTVKYLYVLNAVSSPDGLDCANSQNSLINSIVYGLLGADAHQLKCKLQLLHRK